MVSQSGMADWAPRCTIAHSCQGHASAVAAITFTKNRRYFMSASQDKSLKLWNPQTGANIKTYSGPHNHEINDVIVSEDNSKFASCGGDKHMFLWDVTTGQVIRKFVGHDRKVNALAWGPGEEVLLSASHDKTARVWDMRARSKAAIQTLDDAKDSVMCVCVAGDEIFTGSVDGAVRHYDVRKGRLTVDELMQPVGSLSLSNDAQCLLVSTLDSSIRLIERASGDELARYKGHTNLKYRVQSSLDPSDGFVVSGSEDHRVCFWELVEGKTILTLAGHKGPVLCAQFSGETLVTAAGDGEIKVWNVDSS